MPAKSILKSDEPASAPPQREPNPRQRILVVEDDAVIRRVNVEVLTYSGYHVDAAEDGAAAWDTLQLSNYDLMVTDNDMPPDDRHGIDAETPGGPHRSAGHHGHGNPAG
jgi:PleD family two-component response regulator